MGTSRPAPDDPARLLAELFDAAVPRVFGYLLPRCGSASVAEELTAETFMAAVASIRAESVTKVSVAWLIGIARHKLVDHWRRGERERRNLALLAPTQAVIEEPWDELLDAQRAQEVLARLSATQRLALTLRYLDGFSVAAVAEHLGRSVEATKTLLTRSRVAFRHVYEEEVETDDA